MGLIATVIWLGKVRYYKESMLLGMLLVNYEMIRVDFALTDKSRELSWRR